MGRLSGVESLRLRLPKLCAEFYVLEMAVNHIPDGPAAALFERYLRDTAPKVALTLEYSISTELPFAKSVTPLTGKKIARIHEDCPICDGRYYLVNCYENEWDGCGQNHHFLWCPGCEIHFMQNEVIAPGTKSKYPDSTRHFKKLTSNIRYAQAYNQTFEKYGLQFLEDNRIAFHKGTWSSGYGGKKWGTIADVVSDYWHGVIKPATFLDRAWTLQHNNASVFNKIYSVSGLMTVLEIQAKGKYDALAAYTDPYISNIHRRMERWVDVYSMDLGTHRGIRPGTGTGD